MVLKEGECGYKEKSASLEVDDSFVEEAERVYKDYYELRKLKELFRELENQEADRRF